MNYQFTSRHFNLDNLSRSNQGHMTFKRLYLLNGAYKLCTKHIYSVSVGTRSLGGIERSNQGRLVFIGLCIIHNVLLDSGAVRPRCLLFLSLRDLGITFYVCVFGVCVCVTQIIYLGRMGVGTTQFVVLQIFS